METNFNNLSKLFDDFATELITINHDMILLQGLTIVLKKKSLPFERYTNYPNFFITNSSNMLMLRVSRLLDKRSKDTLNLKYLLKEVKKYRPDLDDEVKKDMATIEGLERADPFKKIKTIRNENIAHKAISPRAPLQQVQISDFEIIFQINNIFKKYNSTIFDMTNVIVPTFSYGEQNLLDVFTFPWLDKDKLKDAIKDLTEFRNRLYEKDGITMI